MKALEFIYQDTEIHFLLGNDKNVMVNATEMAKAFGKRVDNFMRLDETKLFISELLKHENEKIAPSDVSEQIVKSTDIVHATNKATYFHRILALKFAAWLDISFQLWVYAKIEEIKFKHYDAHFAALNEEKKERNRYESLILRAYSEKNELAINLYESSKRIKQLSNLQRSELGKQNREITNQVRIDLQDE